MPSPCPASASVPVSMDTAASSPLQTVEQAISNRLGPALRWGPRLDEPLVGQELRLEVLGQVLQLDLLGPVGPDRLDLPLDHTAAVDPHRDGLVGHATRHE